MRKNCTTCKHDRLKTPICDECYHTSDAPTKWEPATYYEPDTNADRIRAMSDELLASQLVIVVKETIKALTNRDVPDEILNEVRSQLLERLKQPAEV